MLSVNDAPRVKGDSVGEAMRTKALTSGTAHKGINKLYAELIAVLDKILVLKPPLEPQKGHYSLNWIVRMAPLTGRANKVLGV